MSNKYRLVEPYHSYNEYVEQDIMNGGRRCFYELNNVYDFHDGYFTVKDIVNNKDHYFYGISKKKLYEQHGGNTIDLSINKQSNEFYQKVSEIAKELSISLNALNGLIEKELRRVTNEPLILELGRRIEELSKKIEKDKNDSGCILM